MKQRTKSASGIENNTKSEQQNEKRKKNEGSLMELQDNMKYNNIHIVGIPEGEERDRKSV